ncbi:DUF2147 domain-containing protein [Acidimangrovimonas sediminis]|uniref:DUF2147 domain-containing protein n=1 Tax=Acidimangrovimonas sediminis TaxID=2056283 RepID=UPI000C800074|nr:DUF2147 domain-containing protein [Acidimangrovimonas sediminis]
MKNFAIAAALLALTSVPAFAADPLVGTWKTKPDDNGHFGFVDIKPCGGAFCGTLVKAFGADGQAMQSDNVGRRIVWDMKNQGGGHYGGGKVWSPDRDKTYTSKMDLKGDAVAVSGCVLGGMICRNGGTWTRVK